MARKAKADGLYPRRRDAKATFEGLVLYVSQRLNLVLLLMEESLLVA